MKTAPLCDFCREPVDLARLFIYEVESLNFEENPAVLEWIRNHPAYLGEPLRLCKKCHESVSKGKEELQAWENELAHGSRQSEAIINFGCLALLGLVTLLLIGLLVRQLLD
jgi:hypothetical protein